MTHEDLAVVASLASALSSLVGVSVAAYAAWKAQDALALWQTQRRMEQAEVALVAAVKAIEAMKWITSPMSVSRDDGNLQEQPTERARRDYGARWKAVAGSLDTYDHVKLASYARLPLAATAIFDELDELILDVRVAQEMWFSPQNYGELHAQEFYWKGLSRREELAELRRRTIAVFSKLASGAKKQ
ncbi:MAG: hypothetical protein H6721_27965 [Sandaracinus sp.]|nr:hypothetical protein [Sandaracinus sp.]